MLVLGAVMLAVLLASPTGIAAQATDPESVIRALGAARNAGDAEGAAARFADDAALTVQPPPPGTSGVFRGKDQIRALLQGDSVTHFHTEQVNFQVTGDKVTWDSTVTNDTLRKLGLASAVYRHDAVVQGGKIRSFTATMAPDSLAKVQAAMAAQQAQQLPKTGEPSWPVYALLLALGGSSVLAGLGLRFRQRRTP
jgi:LPXTG-motif cell wall-anchored protein